MIEMDERLEQIKDQLLGVGYISWVYRLFAFGNCEV